MRKIVPFETLVGKRIERITGREGDSSLLFECTYHGGDEKYLMSHYQDCCENVYLAEVVGGDLKDILDEEILSAEFVTNEDGPVPEHAESYTWTFYRIRTNSTTLTLRWLGQSNGYYSEGVYFEKL